MTVQQTRWMLRAIAMALLLAASAVAVWAVQTPATVRPLESRRPTAPRLGSAKMRLVSSPPLEEFTSVWRKELRRPLYGSPVVEAPVEEEDSPNRRQPQGNLGDGEVQLVGTMLEDGHSKAVFMDSTGKIDVKGDGETLDLAPGLRVDRIEPTQVTISDQGRLTVLQLPESRAP